MPTLERWFCKLAFAAVLMLVGMPAQAAEAPPPGTEVAKAEIVARILDGRAFELFGERDPAVCFPLLNTLRAGGEAVEFVEPIGRMEYYRDEALLPYRALCPGLALNERIGATGRDAAELPAANGGGGPGSAYFGTAAFKLYALEPDGAPVGGAAHLFYSEGHYRRAEAIPFALRYDELPATLDWNDLLHPENAEVDYLFQGGYTALDLVRCRVGPFHQVAERTDYAARRREQARKEAYRQSWGPAFTTALLSSQADFPSHAEAPDPDNWSAPVRIAGRPFILEAIETGRDPDGRPIHRLVLTRYAAGPAGPTLAEACKFGEAQ